MKLRLRTKYDLMLLSIPLVFIANYVIVNISNMPILFVFGLVYLVYIAVKLYEIKCPNCGKCINGSNTFLRHLISPPYKLAPYKCLHCGTDLTEY
jgi:hypothetical protein